MDRRKQPLIAAAPDDGVQKIIRLMKKHGFSQLPVMEGSKVIGIISEVDLLNALLRDPSNVDHPVADLVDQNYVLVAPDTPVTRLAGVFTEGKIALVEDAGKIQGVITKIDLIDHMAGMMQ